MRFGAVLKPSASCLGVG